MEPPQAAAALPVARAVASTTKGELVLVRVVSAANALGEAERYLRAIVHELQDVHVYYVVQHGKPARESLATASAAQADLIVMATHGRVGLQRILAGSVSERVLAESRVPVPLVRPGGKRVTRLQTLVVPTDGTPGAALALGTAVGLARSSGARLELVQAIEPVPAWIYGDDYGVAPVYLDHDWEEETLRAAQEYADGLAERLRTACMRAHGRACKGNAVSTIQRVADEVDADLIVMSTHALTGPARTLIGSTADALVRTARRPVLMVRRPGGHFDDQPAPDARPLASTATKP
jgi:nucleotide-binding universal stress UspA family protein